MKRIVVNATFSCSNRIGNENEERRCKSFYNSSSLAINYPIKSDLSVKKTIGSVLSSFGITWMAWWIVLFIRFMADFIMRIFSTIDIKAASVLPILIWAEIASFGLTIIASKILF